MTFAVTARNGHARAATLSLSRRTVETPIFMPVATAGALRVLPLSRARDIGYPVILANAYHLYLRPGADIIAANGGLHTFIGWPDNILTDSGGFQVFSLSRLMKITDDGIAFRSHIDGSPHYFTPEMVVDIQLALGSDIIMPLDHCTAPAIGYRDSQIASKRTTHWLERSIAQLESAVSKRNASREPLRPAEPSRPANPPCLFGIVQGNFYTPLRTQSAESVAAFDLPGYAIGGMSVGEEETQFIDMLAHTARLLPDDKPRYLMGVGTPEYFLRAILEGIDMVDCVYPTRVARHGVALTADGAMDMRKGIFRADSRPLEGNCECHTCRKYTRAYINHLTRCKEIMAMALLSEHNLFFMHALCRGARRAIQEQRYRSFMDDFLYRYKRADL